MYLCTADLGSLHSIACGISKSEEHPAPHVRTYKRRNPLPFEDAGGRGRLVALENGNAFL